MKFRKYFILFLLFFMSYTSISAEDIITDKKLITIDTTKQKIFAWEGGRIIFESKVSTGMLLAPTVKGSFKIRRKVPVQDMKGNIKPYGKYHLKNVKHVMYFYQGYAIHGAWWHNKFGVRASHGCVNVPPTEAEWLYNWAELGTRVEVF